MKIQNPHSVTLPIVHPALTGSPLLSDEVFFMSKGYVYFFRHIGTTPIKIGMTTSETVQSRFNSFKTYAPYGAEILGFIETDNPAQFESQLHEQFKDKRLSGEFFEISTDIVDSLIIKYGNKKINQLKQSFELWLSGIHENDVDLNTFKRLILKPSKSLYLKNKEYDLICENFEHGESLMSPTEIYDYLVLTNPGCEISKRKIGIELNNLEYPNKVYKRDGIVFKGYSIKIKTP